MHFMFREKKYEFIQIFPNQILDSVVLTLLLCLCLISYTLKILFPKYNSFIITSQSFIIDMLPKNTFKFLCNSYRPPTIDVLSHYTVIMSCKILFSLTK